MAVAVLLLLVLLSLIILVSTLPQALVLLPPPSPGPHAGLRPGRTRASHSAPKLPNLPPSSSFWSVGSTFLHFVWNIEGCSSLLYSATEILKEKARGLLSGFTVSLLFALGSFFSFYLHFTGSVYASLMLAISAERSS